MFYLKEVLPLPPKNKFTRQQIIDAAFDIAREEGIDGITIRKVADKLGSSVAPIYVNFTDIEALKNAIVHKAFDLSQEMLSRQYSPDPFENIGIASLRFAKEYSQLFRDLVMKRNHYLSDYEPHLQDIVEYMKHDPDLDGFSDEQLMEILFKMRVFQLGLSVMHANELLPPALTEEHLIKVLNSMAYDIVFSARHQKQNDTNKKESEEQ